ncbi:uncharacterized protein LOC132322929 isoform X1 [Haemorhous mexicanus]|uniref:uncharacterized protein LOC132322929 isoform X1 n=1 Tax=Haemorhous mexicanus TaxID=30427 RepID=UPI0028BF4BCD|nr:uncharacterized protein LOC132322929 isoform X1 [Haemorhous mexicanus]
MPHFPLLSPIPFFVPQFPLFYPIPSCASVSLFHVLPLFLFPFFPSSPFLCLSFPFSPSLCLSFLFFPSIPLTVPQFTPHSSSLCLSFPFSPHCASISPHSPSLCLSFPFSPSFSLTMPQFPFFSFIPPHYASVSLFSPHSPSPCLSFPFFPYFPLSVPQFPFFPSLCLNFPSFPLTVPQFPFSPSPCLSFPPCPSGGGRGAVPKPGALSALASPAPLPGAAEAGPPCPHSLPLSGAPTDEATAPLAEGTPPVSGTPRVTPPVSGPPPEPPGDIIPLYCALLAGLVVGLVAYVAFKCWDTCRKKRQLDKARDTGDAGVAADAEKLRGDSGVCPDSAGLEPPQPLPAEGPSALPGSPRRQEEPGELERLLELGAPGSDRRGPGPAGAPGDITSAV